jgi:hypothetical protein
MSSNKILPSEHYLNLARTIVLQLVPGQSLEVDHTNITWVHVQIMRAVIDEPHVTQKIERNSDDR